MKNDLHIRTNFSASADKSWGWERVLQKCQDLGLERISITDFDTCLFHVINKLYDTTTIYNGQIITGMECDVCENGITFELLVYNFEPIKTFNWSYQTYGTLEDRQSKIKNLLLSCAQKYHIAIDTSVKFNGKVDFAHKYLYENMLSFPQNKDFFDKYDIKSLTDFYNLSTKQRDFPLYVSMETIFPSVKMVTDFIHSVGGFVVVGQPCKSKNKDNLDSILNYALKYGVDGIEVYHPAHSKEDIEYLRNFSKQHKMIITGGSNFNGKPESCEFGIKNIDDMETEILQGVTLN